MIKLFDKEQDYEKICRWYLEREQIPPAIDFLPGIGFIVNDVVAGFLYQTDSKICYIESLISDKNSDKQLRRDSVDLFTEHTAQIAKELGYKLMLTNPIFKGFKETPEKWKFEKIKGTDGTFFRRL